MRSKTLYFNPTLFKKNLTRFWPLWGGVSLVGVLFPLTLLTIVIQEGSFGHAVSDPLEFTKGYYLVVAYAVPVISLIYGALCALAVWGWLYNSRSVGMYHSLPATRKELFATDFLSGMAMMLIPYAITGALTVAVSATVGAMDPVGLLVTVLCVLGESFFYFATATLIVFFTGNPFAFVGFYGIFHFLAAGAEQLIALLMTQFYFGVEQAYEGVAEFLSPTLCLIRHVSPYGEYERIDTAEGWVEYGHLEFVTLQNAWVIGLYALAGVALLGCAWALYRRRRSESAGEVVAVGWMKPVFRYGCALCAAFTGGSALYVIFCTGFQTGATAGVLPMAVCMVVAGVIGYYIASMLLAKSLRVFRGSWKGVLATGIAAAAACVFISADPFGVESWVPEAGELEGAYISLHARNGYLDVDISDQATMQKVLDLHRTVLSEKERLNDRDGGFWNAGSGYMNLSYWVEGKRISRYYRLPFSEAGTQAQLESLQKAASLATDPVIQENNIFEQILWEDIVSTRLIHGYIGDIYHRDTREIDGMDLSPEQAKTLEAAVRRDIQAGNFGKTVFLADEEERDRLVYFGSIQLDYNVTWKPEVQNYRNGDDVRTVSFEISVYCTETLKALEDMGILDASHRLLTCAEYYGMEWQEREEGAYAAESFPEHIAEESTVGYAGEAY